MVSLGRRCDPCKRQITTESYRQTGGEGEWVHSGITQGATVHMGKIIVSDPHYLKLSWINEESRIIHFANDL